MNRSQRARAAISVAAVATNLATGLATGSAQAADGSAPGSLQLEEVTVTATKRSESLQNVPVAVTALTAGVLERGNARELLVRHTTPAHGGPAR